MVDQLTREFRAVLQQDARKKDVAEKDKKKRDDALYALTAKTLGISEKRLDIANKERDEAVVARQALDNLGRELENQGVKLDSNTKAAQRYRKLEQQTKNKERAAERRAMPLGKALYEARKDNVRALGRSFNKYLGEGSFVGRRLLGIGKNLATKVTGGIDTLFGILKKGAFVASIALLIAFFNSQLWRDLKVKLIPMLEKGLEFIGEALKKFGQSLKRIFVSFFGDGKDKKGSFGEGIDQIMKEVFGEDYKKAEWYKSLIRTKGFFITLGTFLGYIGDGFMDIFNFITGNLVDENNQPVGRLKFLKDNIGEMATVLGLLAAFFAPSALFAGVYLLGTWTIFKPIQTAFNSLFRALGLLGTQADELAGAVIARAGGGVRRSVKGARYRAASGKIYEALGDGKFRQVLASGGYGPELKGTAAKALERSIQSGSVLSQAQMSGAQNANRMRIIDKYPRIAKLFTSGPGKALLRALPFLGTVLTIGAGANILLSDAPRDQKVKELGGLLFGTLGASGLLVVGAAGGGFIGGGPLGAVIGGIVGGGLGYFAGDMVGRSLADFLLGGSGDAEAGMGGRKTDVDRMAGPSYGSTSAGKAAVAPIVAEQKKADRIKSILGSKEGQAPKIASLLKVGAGAEAYDEFSLRVLKQTLGLGKSTGLRGGDAAFEAIIARRSEQGINDFMGDMNVNTVSTGNHKIINHQTTARFLNDQDPIIALTGNAYGL